MTFWSLTNSDFLTNQTFLQFHDIYTELDLDRLWVVSIEHLQRVWHASRERLPFRTPGSVPHCGTCLCSNCWDQIPPTCHVFTRLFTSNTPGYFLDFASDNSYHLLFNSVNGDNVEFVQPRLVQHSLCIHYSNITYFYWFVGSFTDGMGDLLQHQSWERQKVELSSEHHRYTGIRRHSWFG